ncbi:hypothetical protein WA556_001009 [Blastocystis sp. ATCC 50177/Nand II]
MYGNKYDTDVTVWSPEGKLHQVKYAAEAEKQGSACCGIRTNKYVVLSASRRRPNELASYQKKIVEVDSHMGMAMSGLTADARALSKYMRTECMEHEYIYGRKMPIEMLVRQVSDKEHFCTLTYERRPYGVGFLIAGVDSKGPHLFHTSPSGEYVEYSATAIGSRCQSAKTYLAREFLDAETNTVHVSDDLSVDELIRHALKALKGCIQGDSKLTKENCSVAIVGVDQDFKELSEEELSPYVEAVAALMSFFTSTVYSSA